MDSIPQPAQPNSYLRLIRDEDAPSYDAGFESVTPQSTGGFSMIPTTVFEKLSGDGFALAVYAILVKHVNKEGVCWPSKATICAAVGWSKKVVDPAIGRLVASGLVTKESRKLNGMDQSNIYRVTISHANGQVVPTELAVVPTVPMGGSHGTSGWFPQHHELDPIELDIVKPPLSPSAEGDSPKPRRVIKTPVPDPLVIPSDVIAAMSTEQQLSATEIDFETAKMVDHFRANGERKVDWTATWRNWMRSPYRKRSSNGYTPPNGIGPKFTLDEELAYRKLRGLDS